ncbi:GntR family transcriptional regulator [Paenibacillus thalictri]|uniref:GntR family transcriptional regulator n=1 Tax=Paenibacillus thalictri TaxID=2527873 RepID=A0A4Q9DQ19_9BACL|nr:GntR family transcriptional regulator [Paenibacillus thalictri]TBL76076.1 GntR family transcriptional regulator [Paenibacillus thalictri]
MSIDHLKSKTKSDQVYDFLKEQILSGAYKPDGRIVIRDIGKQLGVSDIPVREAIKRLAADGLLEIKSHSGARVAPINTDNLEEIFLIRLELETLSTRLAAKAATAEEIDILDSLVRQMDESIVQKDLDTYSLSNREFHQLLYRASHAQVLIDMIENLFLRSENSKMVFHYDPDRLLQSNEEHRAIVEAIRQRDEEKAAQIIRTQKESGFKIVLNALRISKMLQGNTPAN